MPDLTAFDYEHDGVRLRGRLALPSGPGPHPGVLVMHDARGLGEIVTGRALALAAQGYAALATDMYGDGAFFTDPRAGGATVGAVMQDHQLLRGRARAALDALAAHPAVDGARLGAIGFCFGGQCVIELARSGAPVRAVVSFHGLLGTRAPARAGEVSARLLVLTGARDPYAPIADVEAFRAEMDAAGADHHVTIYANGWHAFTDPEAGTMGAISGLAYDPLLERLSLAQASAFLDATLKD